MPFARVSVLCILGGLTGWCKRDYQIPMRYTLLLSILLLSACRGDETLSAYGAAESEWRLISINGAAFDARSTIGFPEAGRIAGQAPCNRYSADQNSPYPWFEARAVVATKSACADLPAEQQFFDMLAKMALSEVAGSALILSTESGEEMLFEAVVP